MTAMFVKRYDQHEGVFIRPSATVFVARRNARFLTGSLAIAAVENLVLIGQDRHPQPIGGDVSLEFLEILAAQKRPIFGERMMLHDAVSVGCQLRSDGLYKAIKGDMQWTM